MQWYQMPTFEKWGIKFFKAVGLLPKFWIAAKNFYKGRDKIRWAVYAAVIGLIYFAYLPVFVDWKEKDSIAKKVAAINHLELECSSICGYSTPPWTDIYSNDLDSYARRRELLREVCYSKNICQPLMPEEIENNQYNTFPNPDWVDIWKRLIPTQKDTVGNTFIPTEKEPIDNRLLENR